MIKLVIIVGILIISATCILFARYLEKEDYNNGVCKVCGARLRHFDTDSHGGRGYICTTCGRTCWISYNVDGQRKRDLR